jgi:hypothetical protein
MKMSFLLLFPAIYLAVSCTEAYQLPSQGSQTAIVITGLITNEPGPYYVNVMENVRDASTGKTVQRGINDARVTITDSSGNVDELRPFFSLPLDSVFIGNGVDAFGKPFNVYEYFFSIPDGNGNFKKFHLGWNEDYFLNNIREGAYFTTSTKGVTGNTYTLKVEHAGREYTATDNMSRGTVIDSLSLEPVGRFMFDSDGDDGFLVPCLYFAEPQDEANYYMFTEWQPVWDSDTGDFAKISAKDLVLGINGSRGADWLISVVSDRFMPPYVYQYKMSDGDDHRKYYSGTDMGFYHGRWDDGGTVDMYCISEPVYRYYAALSKQYYDDGGAFSPAPASPPTNFSGGAQGCFSVASVSQYFLDLRNN